jgi:hypothetical protein
LLVSIVSFPRRSIASRQIEQRGFQMADIDLDLPKSRPSHRLALDSLAQLALKEFDLSRNEFVNVERFGSNAWRRENGSSRCVSVAARASALHGVADRLLLR